MTFPLDSLPDGQADRIRFRFDPPDSHVLGQGLFEIRSQVDVELWHD